ncbi:MAG: DNA adenine methylase [Planctomycetes bacterium]|nr:DNA adenine methylase [Planctomycetota bacterium]
MAMATPFLKWAGGKGRVLHQLEPFLPQAFNRYIEPFVGGGAFFFHLSTAGRLASGAILNDLNRELMNCYRVLQDPASVPDLISLLRRYAHYTQDPGFYYRLRALDRSPDFMAKHTKVQRAARTIFLNRTCYNGLYRINGKGWFNVPYAQCSRARRLFRQDNLWACHRALQGVELTEGSFEKCLCRARPADFVYLDPPYDPPSNTSFFTSYNGSKFGEDDHKRLSDDFRALHRAGCLLMLSNSATPFVRSLYQGFRIQQVLAFRAIGSRADSRKLVEEVVVMNY